MRVAVNTELLLSDYLEDSGYFIFEVLKYLTNNFPEHQFIFILARSNDNRFAFSSNITPVITGPPAKHPLLWKYWYDVKLPRILKKIKADVFVSFDGWCSLTTRVPQCLVLNDLAFLSYPSGIPGTHLLFYRKNIRK